MSFNQAVTGMNAAANQLDVIGNNIANSATVGFKSSNIVFADIYAGSKVGMGVSVAAIKQSFNNGTLTKTDNDLDIAITGRGFFRLQDKSGGIYYTRNGQFELDEQRYIKSASGLNLMGYSSLDGKTVQQGASPEALKIPQTMLQAKATEKTGNSLKVNLNSNEKVLDREFNPEDSSTFNYSNAITSYDSLGNQHNIQLFYVKKADNVWNMYYFDTSLKDSKPVLITDENDSALPITFDSTGKIAMSSGNDTDAASDVLTVSIKTPGLNGANELEFDLSLTGSIQQNLGIASGSTKTPVISGYAAGELVGYNVNDDGSLYGIYSNQQRQLLGQVVMADFANPGGLEPVGDNNWRATSNSGQEVIGLAGNGTFGSLSSGSIEASNVDMGQELVNMIVAQRNYQSNSQTIKTQDQILNTLINLR